jgi:hypothetical protein
LFTIGAILNGANYAIKWRCDSKDHAITNYRQWCQWRPNSAIGFNGTIMINKNTIGANGAVGLPPLSPMGTIDAIGFNVTIITNGIIGRRWRRYL